jgi:hypothetical protein
MGATKSVNAVVRTVGLKRERQKEGPDIIKATVQLTFPLDSALISWLGRKIGDPLKVSFETMQLELSGITGEEEEPSRRRRKATEEAGE